MRACIQRVSRARVSTASDHLAEIGRGLVVLLGVEKSDDQSDVDYLADKTVHLRIFPDDEEKMNRSLQDVRGSALVVSQFTLLGDCRKGRRPSFVQAAEPQRAEQLYRAYGEALAAHGIQVATGQFRAMMQVELVNDGPVTLLLDSRRQF